MEKIQFMSRVLQKIFMVLLIALPLIAIYLWLLMPMPNPLDITTNFYPQTVDIAYTVNFYDRLLGLLVSLIPLGLEMFAIYCLIKLFKLYESGKIFTSQNVHYIRNIGIAMLVGKIISPLYQALATFIVHYHNPKGHEALSINFSGHDISYTLISIIILLIAAVMAEACKLKEEQQLTI